MKFAHPSRADVICRAPLGNCTCSWLSNGMFECINLWHHSPRHQASADNRLCAMRPQELLQLNNMKGLGSPWLRQLRRLAGWVRVRDMTSAQRRAAKRDLDAARAAAAEKRAGPRSRAIPAAAAAAEPHGSKGGELPGEASAAEAEEAGASSPREGGASGQQASPPHRGTIRGTFRGHQHMTTTGGRGGTPLEDLSQEAAQVGRSSRSTIARPPAS